MKRMKSSSHLGAWGETLAAEYLQEQGYRILCRNYRTKLGEIDLVARERNVICFVEVKTRASRMYGSPMESVSRAKQRKLTQMAQCYLGAFNLEKAVCRFDVVAIMKQPDGGHSLELLRDAFEASGN